MSTYPETRRTDLLDFLNWDKMIEQGIAALPDKFRNKIDNVAVLLEDEPSKEVRKQEQLSDDETLLGYYQGIPLSERGEGYGVGAVVPDTITLYRLPIIDEAENDPKEVQRVVTETIWHEFGHHFGLDEDEVRKRERVRDRRR